MDMHFTAQELSSFFPESILEGNSDVFATGIAALADATASDLSFLVSRKHGKALDESHAAIVFLPMDYPAQPKSGKAYIRVNNPSDAVSYVCRRIEPELAPKPAPGIHPSAIVDPEAKIDPTAYVGPGCVIQAHAVIGSGCYLQAQVYVGHSSVIGADCSIFAQVSLADHTRIGDRVRLHSGVRLGADGFGYTQQGKPPQLVHVKVPQIGCVVLEDDVEIGANTCVDRARFGETRIGMGTKIDNLVQIAHNVKIGRHCILCAEVGISGSTTIGHYVVFWGQSAAAGHLTIGNGCFISGQAGVNCDLPDGAKVSGTPAYDYFQERRSIAASKQLPDMLKRIKSIEKQLDK
ncbi:MAG: UDP-3-O-(3-hydroxymyristoyl)glucosamine N-acyltransferase [Opitutales bacterium]|nr:UDP-3-O-(3-hydroxymyristoyl)glucosamine N-acyltransferase [Opitutales bacterium]